MDAALAQGAVEEGAEQAEGEGVYGEIGVRDRGERVREHAEVGARRDRGDEGELPAEQEAEEVRSCVGHTPR